MPLISSIPSVTSTIQLSKNTTIIVASTSPTVSTSQNVFVAIATGAPPSQIPSRGGHPVPQLGISKQNGSYETNKFYANFFLGEQSNAVWTHPYSLTWSQGGGETGSWGIAVSHIERSQLAWATNTPPEYFINPIGIQSIVLSAAELCKTTNLTTDTLKGFSVNANLVPSPGAQPLISFPLVQGMGYVTALYNGATVLLQSGVFFNTLTYAGPLTNGKTYKYRIALDDNTKWLLYITPSGAAGAPPFNLTNSSTITGPSGFFGTVQVAKNPANSTGEEIYDASAGVYPIGATISGSVSGATGTYSISWEKAGLTNQTLLMFALPHHVESLSGSTNSCITSIQLETTTKGLATALITDRLTCVEDDLPTYIGFNPWSPTATNVTSLSSTAIKAINSAAVIELSQNMLTGTNLGSMYYSGKALAKYATAIYTTKMLAGNDSLAAAGLVRLEEAYAVFINNQQSGSSLVYDTVWGGAVNSAGYPDNSGADFGNTFYNDHHFHYVSFNFPFLTRSKRRFGFEDLRRIFGFT